MDPVELTVLLLANQKFSKAAWMAEVGGRIYSKGHKYSLMIVLLGHK